MKLLLGYLVMSFMNESSCGIFRGLDDTGGCGIVGTG